MGEGDSAFDEFPDEGLPVLPVDDMLFVRARIGSILPFPFLGGLPL